LERLNRPNLEVRRHNILEHSIEDLGLGSFDMVSLRLVLFWLVGRQEEVIGRIVQCLRPGGWLVDEDGDWGTVVPVNPFHPMYERYQQVWKNGDWWTARGYDPEFGRKLPALIEQCGLPLRLVFDVGFLFTGGSMFALSLGTGYALARRLLSSRQAMAVTGFGCAIILWLAALMIFALGHTMNAVSISSARTMKCFPSPRCASANK